jgi:uncharacterized SAM-binding protein YcdF (DUF218 family)
LALIAIGAASVAAFGVGWWVNFGQPPVKSDIIVALAGSYSRPAYAADLYVQGLAPEVWISRPRRQSAHSQLDNLGISLPREENINRDILLKRGVPAKSIRFYGDGVNSTADEAAALRKEFSFQGKKILVVTSRFHARRSRLVFRRMIPEASVVVAATPYENFTTKWWKDKELASNSVLEMFKTVFFLAGGRIRQ